MNKSADPFRVLLGKRILRLRRKAKLSQAALAKQVSCSQQLIGKIELAEVGCSIDNLEAIAKAFGMTVSELTHVESEISSEEMRSRLRRETQEFVDSLSDEELRAVFRLFCSILNFRMSPD